MSQNKAAVLWFKDIDKDDGNLVGGKGANLGEMMSFKITVPNGFVVTSQAYFDFLKNNHFKTKIRHYLQGADLTRPEQLNDVSHQIKRLIMTGKIDPSLAKQIIDSYLKLGGLLKHAIVAIRSSATAEDLPGASFAGQQATFLNVQGEANVVEKVRQCWASLFEPRAIFYREEKGFDHFKVGMAVPVQEMIPAEVSGVMFTIDPISNQKNRLVIEAIYGLGEYIVQGVVSPDQYLIEKNSLKILDRRVAKQTVQLVKAGQGNKEIKVPRRLQTKQKLTVSQIKQLAKIGKKIHRHYYYPQDIEWLLHKGKLWIVQTRPVTTVDKAFKAQNLTLEPKKVSRQLILQGTAASPGLASGPVKLIKTAKNIHRVEEGDVLVTSMTTPDFVPAMKRAVAIITDKGGQTSHAAIISRELGIPCVVGTKNATKILKNKQIVTVHGSQGTVYRGSLGTSAPTASSLASLNQSVAIKRPLAVKTATKIYTNLGEPHLAEQTARQNVDGVGLCRAEFMIANIGIHPKKLIKERRQKQFVDQLTEGLVKICQAFDPRPVVYRATDFKTNEYRSLVGGAAYEPEEANPLLGYRGAFRYQTDEAVFELELAAIKQVRNKHGFKNLWLMIPFCHTPQELAAVKKIIVSNGLVRSPSFQLWMMVEIPSNVILLEEFIKVGIDGVSIGSNDLTMLILGIDRDNPALTAIFDERHPAVLWALEHTIKICHQLKITASICGQAPTTYPDLAEKLVEWGIDSLSVSPDALDRTREVVYAVESKILSGNKCQK